jgi:hypothetical protein
VPRGYDHRDQKQSDEWGSGFWSPTYVPGLESAREMDGQIWCQRE